MGKSLYVMKPPQGNIITSVVGAIYVCGSFSKKNWNFVVVCSTVDLLYLPGHCNMTLFFTPKFGKLTHFAFPSVGHQAQVHHLGEPRALAWPRTGQVRPHPGGGRQAGAQGAGHVHSHTGLLGALRPAGIQVDLPGNQVNKKWKFSSFFLVCGSWYGRRTRMNGAVGSYVIKPDQMQLVNPAFILILIPLFDTVIYPFFAKWEKTFSIYVGNCSEYVCKKLLFVWKRFHFLVKPLQRMCVGGFLTAAAFAISGFLELQLQVESEKKKKRKPRNFVPC